MQSDIYKTIKAKKSNKTIFIVISILLIVGIIAFCYFKFNKKEVLYITQNPVIEDISQDVSATGTLDPTNTVEVGTEVSGTITEVYVDTNDSVKKGQILAKIDTEKLLQSVDNYQAQLESAKADLYSANVTLENKKWNYDNYLDLYKQTNGKTPSQLQLKTSELDYKSALADVNMKKAAIAQIETSLNSAKIDVQKAVIKSPINGVVLSRSIEAGQTVAANYSTPTLFTIAEDLTKMELTADVLEADIGKVKVGQDVEFVVDAYPNEVFKSKVAKVDFADTSSTSTNSNSNNSSSSSSSSTNIISYEVTTYVDNSKLLLRPGMSATATIKTAVAKNALVIPYQALLFKPTTSNAKNNSRGFMMRRPRREMKTYSEANVEGSRAKIYVLNNGVPEPVEVDIGISNGKDVQVLSNNINENTKVILQMQQPN